MKLEHKIVGFEMKAASGDGSEFEGYASCFFNIDSYGDIIDAGAFADTLTFFLNEGFIGGLNHNWDNPIGKPIEAREDSKGLFSKAKISATVHGEEVKVLLKDGVIKKLSIGFRIMAREWLDTAEDVIAYWQRVGYTPTAEDLANCAYGARLITKVKLYEYSPVTVPANSTCDITGVKGEGAPAALQLPDHFLHVLATNEELMERVTSVFEKRAAEDRTLPEQRIAQLKRLRDQMNALLAKTDTPSPEAPSPEAQAKADADAITEAQATEAQATEAQAAEAATKAEADAKAEAAKKQRERRSALLELETTLLS